MRHAPRTLALALTVAALAAAAAPATAGAAAGSPAWAPWGPGQGTIQAQALDAAAGPAGVCFAPQLGGVLCSADGGGTWEPRNTGLDGANVVALAADPGSGGLLAATAGGALYRRAGGTWELLNDGRAWGALSDTLVDRPFGVLLVPSPARGRWTARLYLAAATRVFRSDDGGGTWRLALTTDAPVSDLAVDPQSPRIVYVASRPDPSGGGAGGLLKSVDGGASWTPVGPAGGWTNGVGLVAAAAASPGAPAAVIAAPGYPGLLRSRDGGATWEELATATTPDTLDLVTALAIDPVSPATLIASRADGVFLSPDGGDTWRLFGGRQPPFIPYDVTRLAIGPGARRLYAATQSVGLFATDNRGRRWTSAYGSVQAGDPRGGRLRFDPADPATVFALQDGFAYRSVDGGASWASFGGPFEQPAVATIADLAFGPPAAEGTASTLYAATAGTGLQVSRDLGASWRSLGGPAYLLAVAVLTPRTLLAGGCGVSLSRDGGRTWAQTLSCDDPGDGSHPDDFFRQVNALVVDPADSLQVYARVIEASDSTGPGESRQQPRVFRSADGGATWRPVLDGSDVVAVDPSRPRVVYLLAGSELRRSTDRGRTFTTVQTAGLAGFTAQDLAVDPVSPSVLYAAGQGGLRRSADGGRTWAPAEQGLAPRRPLDPSAALYVTNLFFDPAAPGALFAAANGVFYRAVFP